MHTRHVTVSCLGAVAVVGHRGVHRAARRRRRPSVPRTRPPCATARRRSSSEFGRLSRAAEWDSLGALYSDRPDFTFLESGLVQYASAQAVREALRSVPPGQFIDTQYDTLTIVPLAPGAAVVSGTFTTRFAERAGDSVQTLFSYGGALSLVLHHEPDGWRIASGHSSAVVPRGPGAPSAAAGSGPIT